MPRRPLIALLTAVAVVVVPADLAAAHRMLDGSGAHARVRLFSCSRADHSAVFYARMRAVRAGERMAIRFALLRRDGSGRFRRVRAPGLGGWRTSKPGVRVLGWRQRVNGLEEGRAYRLQVRFRWYDAEGHRIRATRRRSRTCRQYEALPNLTTRLLWSAPSDHPAFHRYAAELANRGEAEAPSARLRLLVDGAEVDTRTLAALRPGETRVVYFTGPPCARSLEAVADPDGAVVESSEADNRHAVPCGGPY